MNDREKVICPSVKFATKVFIPKRAKTGENANAAKAWQERLSVKRQNRAIAKGRICYLLSMDNCIEPRDAEQCTAFVIQREYFQFSEEPRKTVKSAMPRLNRYTRQGKLKR